MEDRQGTVYALCPGHSSVRVAPATAPTEYLPRPGGPSMQGMGQPAYAAPARGRTIPTPVPYFAPGVEARWEAQLATPEELQLAQRDLESVQGCTAAAPNGGPGGIFGREVSFEEFEALRRSVQRIAGALWRAGINLPDEE